VVAYLMFALVPHDVEPQCRIELVDDERGFEIARQIQDLERLNIDVALDQEDLGDLLAEFGSVGADRGVRSTKFRTDIGPAFIEQRVEFAKRSTTRVAAGNACRQFGENLLELGFAFALVLIILLEKEDEQGNANPDQDHAHLRKDVAIIFQQLFTMA